MSLIRLAHWAIIPTCAALTVVLSLQPLLHAQQHSANHFAPRVPPTPHLAPSLPPSPLETEPSQRVARRQRSRRVASNASARYQRAPQLPSTAGGQATLSDVQLQANRDVGLLTQMLSQAQRRAESLEAPAPHPTGPQPPVHRVPIAGANIDIQQEGDLVSLTVRNAVLKDVLSMLAETVGLNVVSADEVSANVSITLDRVTVEQALNSIVSVAGYRWTRHNGIIHVTTAESMKTLPAAMQNLRVQVFQLDFVSAADLEGVVNGMLSPSGKAHSIATSPEDTRKSREAIVVEDTPAQLDRIAAYIASIDVPPRQVAIEAHILQVQLSDSLRHGINLEHLANLSNHSFTVSTVGMATGMTQGLMAQVTGPNVNSLIELIKTTNDAKTLASPSLTVINGQTARLQVGEQLGFFVTTATETTALQSVEFLNVGVVLEVTPHISRDNQVLMRVTPEVSSGSVNPETGLPEEETTEVQTSVLLDSGKGVLLGGLIRETDTDGQGKVPFFGDLHIFGPLFQRRERKKERSEIIIALIPRVLPMFDHQAAINNERLDRATSPLLHGPLLPAHRPWEPKLPNAFDNPRHLCGRVGDVLPFNGGYAVEQYDTYDSTRPDEQLNNNNYNNGEKMLERAPPGQPQQQEMFRAPPQQQAPTSDLPQPGSVIRQAEPFRAASRPIRRLPRVARAPRIEHLPPTELALPRLPALRASTSSPSSGSGGGSSNADRAARILR